MPDTDTLKASHRQGGTVKFTRTEFATVNKTDYDSGTGRNFAMSMNLNLSAQEEYNKLVTHPTILRALESLWGYTAASEPPASRPAPSIYYYGEQLFLKEANSAPISWHTDTADLPMAGPDVATLWI